MAALLQFHVILTVTVTKLKYETASNITCGSKVLELYSYFASGFPPLFIFCGRPGPGMPVFSCNKGFK